MMGKYILFLADIRSFLALVLLETPVFIKWILMRIL